MKKSQRCPYNFKNFALFLALTILFSFVLSPGLAVFAEAEAAAPEEAEAQAAEEAEAEPGEDAETAEPAPEEEAEPAPEEDTEGDAETEEPAEPDADAATEPEQDAESEASEEAQEEAGETQPTAELSDEASYLASIFGLDVTTELTQDAYLQDLVKVSGLEEDALSDEALAPQDPWTLASAIRQAVFAASYEELALSYTDEKVTDRLAAHELSSSGDVTRDRYVVTGLDAQLFPQEVAERALAEEAPAPEQEELLKLIYSVAEAMGNTRQFLGYSDDPEIHAKLRQFHRTFTIFEDEALNNLGKEAVESKFVTGFNLKRAAYDARFNPALTLQYGHDSIDHAHQLLVLLQSEGLRARVQLEPKISIYEYLLEWGPIGEPTPTYAIEEAGDDFYLVHSVEYDLLLEFENEEELARFDQVVQTYAKKWEGNEDAVGLIKDSWWQPLYTVLRDDMNPEDYHEIYDLIVRDGDYRFHSFVTVEDMEATKAELQKLVPELEVESQVRYCNHAFYNYLTGADSE